MVWGTPEAGEADGPALSDKFRRCSSSSLEGAEAFLRGILYFDEKFVGFLFM